MCYTFSLHLSLRCTRVLVWRLHWHSPTNCFCGYRRVTSRCMAFYSSASWNCWPKELALIEPRVYIFVYCKRFTKQSRFILLCTLLHLLTSDDACIDVFSILSTLSCVTFRFIRIREIAPVPVSHCVFFWFSPFLFLKRFPNSVIRNSIHRHSRHSESVHSRILCQVQCSCPE